MSRDHEMHDTGAGREDAADARDDALGAALRSAAPAPPIDAVDFAALHARISAAAAPTLARQHRRAPARAWWQPLAGWSAAGIPLAAAASVLLVLAAGGLQREAGPAAGAMVAFRTLEEELAEGLSTDARQLFAEVGSEAVLDVALFSDGEDW